MNFNLNLEQKIKTLNASKDAVLAEMYVVLVKMGIDPDTFEVTDEITMDPRFSGEKYRLEGLIQSYNMIESKLSALQ